MSALPILRWSPANPWWWGWHRTLWGYHWARGVRH
jgi:hypothetical protein